MLSTKSIIKGQRYGTRVILTRMPDRIKSGRSYLMAKVRCDCGKIRVVLLSALQKGQGCSSCSNRKRGYRG